MDAWFSKAGRIRQGFFFEFENVLLPCHSPHCPAAPRCREHCTTNIVPGAFTEGCADWDDYEQWTTVRAPALIFDSEMLHRGGSTRPGAGWSATLTLQVCSGTGYPVLSERVDDDLLRYTQVLGWEAGCAVDACIDGTWGPAIVHSRDRHGRYTVAFEMPGTATASGPGAATASGRGTGTASGPGTGTASGPGTGTASGPGTGTASGPGTGTASGLTDADLRYRQAPTSGISHRFCVGEHVEGLHGARWYQAKVARCNADGSYRLTWTAERSFSDGLRAGDVRAVSGGSAAAASVNPDGKPEHVIRHASTDSDNRPVARKRAQERRRRSPEHDSPPPKRCREAPLDLARPDDCRGTPAEPRSDGPERRSVYPARDMRAQIFTRGWSELPDGLPQEWRRWPVFGFVEAYYDHFHALVTAELEALRPVWQPCEGSNARHGAFAAAKASARLAGLGIAVYSPSDSQSEAWPYNATGPRWYVSVTQAALRHFGVGPAPPPGLSRLLCSDPADQTEGLRARGLGWTLAPAGADPQGLHADLWGTRSHARRDRTRWPHILWKRDPGAVCTTEVVPGGFTQGAVWPRHYTALRRVRAPAIIVDSEALHRGACTPAGPATSWVSTLSLELCTPSGWAAWEAYATGGTVKETSSELDWRMISFALPALGSSEDRSTPTPLLAPAALPQAPWEAPGGLEALRREQHKWEFAD